jgi:hypothetical protein
MVNGRVTSAVVVLLIATTSVISAAPARAGFGDDLRDAGRIFDSFECAFGDRESNYCYNRGRHRRDDDYSNRRPRRDSERDRERRQEEKERERIRTEYRAYEDAFYNYQERYSRLDSRSKQIAGEVFRYKNRSANPSAQGLDDVLVYSGWHESDRRIAQAELKQLNATYKQVPKHLRDKLTSDMQRIFWYRNY